MSMFSERARRTEVYYLTDEGKLTELGELGLEDLYDLLQLTEDHICNLANEELGQQYD